LLRWRLISAAIILAVLFALLWLDFKQIVLHAPGAWLLPVLLVVSVLATEEVLCLLRSKNHLPVVWQLAGRAFPDKLGVGPGGWPLIALALAAAAVFVGEMARYKRPGAATTNAALSILTLVYVGLCISFWSLLRLYRDNAWGMAALFSVLLIVKMADVGAFAFGKRFGRHKLTPVLSPGKTWEGAIGGVAVACVTSWAFFQFGAPQMFDSTYQPPSLAATIVYGLVLALAGIVGDLAESLLKRDMECKDSSTWLRGLGGVLDIIDAPLIAGPVAWLCWTLGLIGPGA
jgi:phosphatidate cytidylyltransferase